MGITTIDSARPIPPGADQDALLDLVYDEFNNKGFVVASLDNLANWARTGSLWPMTFDAGSRIALRHGSLWGGISPKSASVGRDDCCRYVVQ